MKKVTEVKEPISRKQYGAAVEATQMAVDAAHSAVELAIAYRKATLTKSEEVCRLRTKNGALRSTLIAFAEMGFFERLNFLVTSPCLGM